MSTVTKPLGAPLTKSRDFLLLWAGQSISLLGTEVTNLALPLFALITLRATTLEVSLITTAETLPVLLFALHSGAIVDRFRRRTVMVLANLVRCLVIASLPITHFICGVGLTQVYAVAFVSTILAGFFSPAWHSYVPDIVAKRQLVEANAKLSLSSAVVGVVGPAGAGLLITAFGAAQAISVDAASYLVSAVSLIAIRKTEPARTRRGGSSMHHEIREGLRFVWRDPELRLSTCAASIATTVLTATTALWLVYVYRNLHWTPSDVGLVLGLGTVGGVGAGLFSAKIIGRLGLVKTILISSAAYPLDLLPTLVAGRDPTGKVFVVAGLIVMIFAAVVFNVATRSLRQLGCPKELLGRMNASTRWMTWGPRPIAAVGGGLLASCFGLRFVLWGLCVALVVPFLLLAIGNVNGRRRGPRGGSTELSAAEGPANG